jgi:RNA polymerase sigma factor (TIGR02999 family)
MRHQARNDTVIALLGQIRQGRPDAEGELLALVLPALRRLAAQYMRRERPDHTLQTTALVHEAYIRLLGSTSIDWQDRSHFYGVMATHMRRILVDHARARNAARGPGKAVRVVWEDTQVEAPGRSDDLVALDEALTRLAEVDARASRVVELKCFGGLTETEAADVIGISLATVKRDWTFAKAWLFRALTA